MYRRIRGGVVFLAGAVLLGSTTPAAGEESSTADTTSRLQDASDVHEVDRDEIARLPTRGYFAIAALQAGVVIDRRTNALYIRGGDAKDNDYYVDGLSQRDDFTGQPSAVVSNNMLESVVLDAGTLGAEYTNVTGGLVDIRTTEGTSRLHGVVETATDNFHGESYDYNIYSLALNGPVFPGSDKLTFAAAAERLWFGNGRWNWQGKIRWRPSDAVTARFGTLGLDADWRSYPRAFLFNQEHAPRHTLKHNSVWGEIIHTPSEETWYRLRAGWFKVESKSGDGVYFDDLWRYGRPGPDSWQTDETDLFYSWDDMTIDAGGNQIITPTYDSVLSVPLEHDTVDIAFTYNFTRLDSVVTDSAGHRTEFATTFADEGAVYDDFRAHQTSYVEGRFDLAMSPYRGHSLQGGLSFRRHTVRSYHDIFPTNIYWGWPRGFNSIDAYGYDALANANDEDGWNGAKHPINLGVYVQDLINLGDLLVTGGARVDYFDYDALIIRDPSDPFGLNWRAGSVETADGQNTAREEFGPEDLTDAETHVCFSPRLSVAFPVVKRTTAYFSSSGVYRRPAFEDLYMDFGYLAWVIDVLPSSGIVFPSAALEPIKTITHEVGAVHEIGDIVSVRAAGFYKTRENLPIVVHQPAFPYRGYLRLRSDGQVIARGVEVELKANPSRGVSAQVSYSHQNIDGIYQPLPGPPTWEGYHPDPYWIRMAYERQHTLTTIVDLRLGPGEGPVIGTVTPFERAGVNLVFRTESGLPYTPSNASPEASLIPYVSDVNGPINSKYMPALYRLDFKANKLIPLGRMSFDVYLWVLNLFDRDNPIYVYSSTGEPDETGWLNTEEGQVWTSHYANPTDVSGLSGAEKYRLRVDDPDNLDIPRQIRFGVRLLF
jgi:hypothetical protein